jgi:uncharacterized protein
LQRIDVRIPAEGGVTLGAWLFLPDATDKKRPAITMAHGFCGVKEHGLEKFATAFAEAGFVVCVHDHRGFGASEGEPRQEVEPNRQIEDWRWVISYLEAQPEVDPQNIGIWGTSYSGGHAIILAATDRRLRCAVAQVPLVDGFRQLQRYMSPTDSAALEQFLLHDDRARSQGSLPIMQTIASADPSIPAIIRVQESVDFYHQPIPEGIWENQVTIRSMRSFNMYNAGEWVDRVSPTPLLFVVADADILTATDLALAAYERALEPKKLVLLPGRHTGAFLEQFSEASKAAIDWFKQYLERS